jgi:hypothetical protein
MSDVENPKDLATIEELKEQVWVYSHKRSGGPDKERIGVFPGKMDGRAVVPVESRGRKRLLSILKKTPHSEDVAVWPRAGQDVLLTEKSLCARRLRDFFQAKRLVPPEFLDMPIVLPRTGTRTRRRSLA